MPDVHTIMSSASLHRPPACGKDHALSLPRRYHMRSRLRPRTLLHQHKFSAGKIQLWPVEHENRLQRKINRAIEVLMQAVVTAALIAQHQRRGARLAAGVAELDELLMRGRIMRLASQF